MDQQCRFLRCRGSTMGTAGECCEHYQLLRRECLRSIYPYDGADETLADEVIQRISESTSWRPYAAAATAATSSAAALCGRPHRRPTPTSSNANIELERKAIGNVSRAMHLSDEDEEDDDSGDAAHQAGEGRYENAQRHRTSSRYGT
jgi:hypothetical protein